MRKKRFEEITTEGIFSSGKIIVDTETGVNYLFWQDGYAGGITPLLNKDGSVVVSSIDN